MCVLPFSARSSAEESVQEATATEEKTALAPDITPSDEQAGAIKKIVEWYRQKNGPQEYYVAGYAGTGKSTVCSIAIDELRDRCGVKNVRTAAYTGKAASVLRKKGNPNAQTIHSLIYTAYEDEETGELRFAVSDESPAAEADLIVIDECSMASKDLAEDLRGFGKRVLVLGDPGQLPPINGEGAFTNREPDVFLRQIHRQAESSPVIELATLAREGKPWPIGYEKDGVRVLPLNRETQPLIYREETQPICGLNRVRYVYNLRIRKIRGFDGEAPQVGERLICCRNNREEGLFNGGMGILRSIKPDKDISGAYKMDIDMEDLDARSVGLHVDPYLFRRHFTSGEAKKLELPKGVQRLDEYDYSACLTAHKSQGSQFPDVTVIDDSAAFREHRDKWRYTVATRSEEKLTILLRS
jgi:exodeoxyribonuclease V